MCSIESSTRMTFNHFNLTNKQIDDCPINQNIERNFEKKDTKLFTDLVLIPKQPAHLILLKTSINFTALDNFLDRYKKALFFLKFDFFNVFELNNSTISPPYFKSIAVTYYEKSKLDFFVLNVVDNALIFLQTCQDFLDHNLITSKIGSIFKGPYTKYGNYEIRLMECEFKNRLCPLLFLNSRLDHFEIDGMFTTFLKLNILRFSQLPPTWRSTSINSTEATNFKKYIHNRTQFGITRQTCF